MKQIVLLLSFTVMFSLSVQGQRISTLWDELTASEFTEGVQKAEGVCLVPIGVVEKHGQHLPLGTDVLMVREISRRAAEKEYCIVFPYYYGGQNFVATPQPGAIAYSAELLFKMLDETCREIARNGMKKIILVNGHGGNNFFLPFFCQAQMESPRDYVVYWLTPSADEETQKKIRAMRKTTTGGHADEMESSNMMAAFPNLVKIDRATRESGDNQKLSILGELTGLRWFAQFPNHYAGDAKDANAAIGELSIESTATELAKLIKAVKADKATPNLQEEYFKKNQSPLETKPR